MGKAAVALGVSAGGATLTAGGNYMLGDPIGEALRSASTASEELSSEILSEDGEEDVENAGNKYCLENHFAGLNIEHERDDVSQWKTKGLSRTKKIESSFFNVPGGDVTPKSCLFVH